MINYQKLFRSIRLNPCDDLQAKKIAAFLAALQVEEPEEAKNIAAQYEARKVLLGGETPAEEAVVETPVETESETPAEEVKTKKPKKSSPTL